MTEIGLKILKKRNWKPYQDNARPTSMKSFFKYQWRIIFDENYNGDLWLETETTDRVWVHSFHGMFCEENTKFGLINVLDKFGI